MKTTRGKLLREARDQFADKGFYGTSINDVAAKLGLSKQGLLHHFPTKEKLYGAVLEEATDAVMQRFEKSATSAENPEGKMMAIIESFATLDDELVGVSRLMVRELLDNLHRAGQSHRWYMLPFLSRYEEIILEGQDKGVFNNVHPMAFLYQIIGAQQYFIISLPTLERIHSAEDYQSHLDNHLEEMRRIVRGALLRQAS